MSSLDVLKRLAAQAVDQERRALSVITAEITDVEGQIEACLAARNREMAEVQDFRTSGATFSAFLQASTMQVQALRDRLEQLQRARAAQVERVWQERMEEKRYERLIERRAERMAAETSAREQKAIDDLVVMRHRKG